MFHFLQKFHENINTEIQINNEIAELNTHIKILFGLAAHSIKPHISLQDLKQGISIYLRNESFKPFEFTEKTEAVQAAIKAILPNIIFDKLENAQKEVQTVCFNLSIIEMQQLLQQFKTLAQPSLQAQR